MDQQSYAKPYIIGFIASLGLTLLAYFFVSNNLLSGFSLTVAIAAFCLLQALVQLVFFLQPGRESTPLWNGVMLSFMVLVIIIVVGGSLWIMSNLNYRVMPPSM